MRRTVNLNLPVRRLRVARPTGPARLLYRRPLPPLQTHRLQRISSIKHTLPLKTHLTTIDFQKVNFTKQEMYTFHTQPLLRSLTLFYRRLQRHLGIKHKHSDVQPRIKPFG